MLFTTVSLELLFVSHHSPSQIDIIFWWTSIVFLVHNLNIKVNKYKPKDISSIYHFIYFLSSALLLNPINHWQSSSISYLFHLMCAWKIHNFVFRKKKLSSKVYVFAVFLSSFPSYFPVICSSVLRLDK